MADAPPAKAAVEGAPVFVTGSTMRHVVVMTGTGSVGLIATFVVDLLSLLYVSWLGDPRLTAAIGFATIVLFMAISINVGLMIAIAALVSRALGARERGTARRLAASGMVHVAIVAGLVALVLLPLLPRILAGLGAQGETLSVAERFLWITLPSNPLLALGMALSGILRAVGDAKRAMYVTLAGGAVTVWLDPLLIFGLGLGVDGAAIATVVSRLVFLVVGLWGAVAVHRLVARPRLSHAVQDLRPMAAIAVPAVLTNVATPVASAFLASVLARFGDPAIAANAIIDRIVPVAFGGLFALSGTIGPILGQNWGAGEFGRMRAALRDGAVFAALYVGTVWLILILARGELAALFRMTGLAAELVGFFCIVSGPIWFFNGLLFVANASFNNLGFPVYSALFNWGRATVGTMPFAALGAELAGAKGAIAGVGMGSFLFGVSALVVAFRTIHKLERRELYRAA